MGKRTALVTGCSSGFGEAIALGLLEQGIDVIATLRRPESARDSLRRSGVRLLALDVTDAESRQKAVAQAVADFGRIDILVNNAGIGLRGAVENTPEDELRSVMETNFFGPVALTQLVLPIMREQRSGRIVNVTAIGALLCSPFLSGYCASKHALDAVGAALDIEARALGIRVSSVLPAQFKTAIAVNMPTIPVGEAYKPVSDELARQFQARTADAESDLRPVVAAVLSAVNDAEPKPRYVVGKGGALLLPPVIDALEGIHRIEHERARIR